MFKYGSVKLFFSKILIGLLVLALSVFIFISLINNSMGYFGALLSSIILVFSLSLIAALIIDMIIF